MTSNLVQREQYFNKQLGCEPARRFRTWRVFLVECISFATGTFRSVSTLSVGYEQIADVMLEMWMASICLNLPFHNVDSTPDHEYVSCLVKLNHFFSINDSGIKVDCYSLYKNMKLLKANQKIKLASSEKQAIKSGYISEVGTSDDDE